MEAVCLPETAFKIVHQETGSMVAGQLKSPDYLFRRALHEDLHPKEDPALRQPASESVAPMALTNLVDYYKKVFRQALTTIVVIGNITPEKVMITVENYFGTWRAEGEKPATDLPPVPPNKPATTAASDAERVQDLVREMQTSLVTPNELRLAKTILVREIPRFHSLCILRYQ